MYTCSRCIGYNLEYLSSVLDVEFNTATKDLIEGVKITPILSITKADIMNDSQRLVATSGWYLICAYTDIVNIYFFRC